MKFNIFFKKTPGFILLLLILCGCSDSENNNDFVLKKEYITTDVEFSKVRIFTNKGEIKDKKIYNKAIERYNQIFKSSRDQFFNFDYDNKNVILELNMQNLKFKIDSATIVDDNKITKYKFKIKDNFINFTNFDTTTYNIYNFSKYKIFREIEQYKTKYYKVNIFNNGVDVIKQLKTIPERYARIFGNSLRFPYVTAFIVYRNKNNFYSHEGVRLYNELNQNAYKSLSDVDTLYLQQNWLIFK